MSAGSHFNTELAKCRINAKMTLAQVSELTGIDQSTLQNWERGRNKSIHVAVDKVMLLAELYDVSYSDIENMVQAAYQTAKKEGYTNIGKKKYKKTKKSKKSSAKTAIQAEQPIAESTPTLVMPSNRTNNPVHTETTQKTTKMTLLELAYGEVTFTEFMAMVKAFF